MISNNIEEILPDGQLLRFPQSWIIKNCRGFKRNNIIIKNVDK